MTYYVCDVCKKRCKTIQGYVNPCSLHRNIYGVNFPCVIANCKNTFKSYSSLKSHIYRAHVEPKQRIKCRRDIDVILRCTFFCCSVTTTTFDDLLTHMKSHFGDGNGNAVHCPYEGCTMSYTKKTSCLSHLARKHCSESVNTVTSNVISDSVSTEVQAIGSACDDDDDYLNSNDREEFIRSMGLFCLKLQAKLLLPASSVQRIIEELGTVNAVGQKHIWAWLNLNLTQEVTEDKLDELKYAFFQNDLVQQCTSGALRSDESRKS